MQRNLKKIEASIANARTVQAIQREHGSFCSWFYDALEGDDLAALQKMLRRTFKPESTDGQGWTA